MHRRDLANALAVVIGVSIVTHCYSHTRGGNGTEAQPILVHPLTSQREICLQRAREGAVIDRPEGDRDWFMSSVWDQDLDYSVGLPGRLSL